MIPTAILAGFLLGLVWRWWAVPVVALGWVVLIIAFVDTEGVWFGAVLIVGGLLGAANGAAGVLVALAIRKLAGRTTRRARVR